MGIIKDPIRLRRRKMKTGITSLYLDTYMDGKRSYEYLRLYLIPEATREDKAKNKETLQLAEVIRAKRLVELRNGQYGFSNGFAEDTNFFEYYSAICEQKYSSETLETWGGWKSTLKQLENYDSLLKKRNFKDITPQWVEGFKQYLLKKSYSLGISEENDTGGKLSLNTCQAYFKKLKACLNSACENNILRSNPAHGISGIQGEEGTRMYLTVEELRRLVNTPCGDENVRRTFLFSCLTGLRKSDIIKMTWGEVQQQGEFTRIIFRQKKTREQEYLDITPQAFELMGERKSPDEKVFTFSCNSTKLGRCIQQWVLDAGIQKKITFHCGRHTFATMMLELGTDIYTVSKLLGHRKLGTTQVYVRVLDKSKQAAVSSIPNILNAEPLKEK